MKIGFWRLAFGGAMAPFHPSAGYFDYAQHESGHRLSTLYPFPLFLRASCFEELFKLCELFFGA